MADRCPGARVGCDHGSAGQPHRVDHDTQSVGLGDDRLTKRAAPVVFVDDIAEIRSGIGRVGHFPVAVAGQANVARTLCVLHLEEREVLLDDPVSIHRLEPSGLKSGRVS